MNKTELLNTLYEIDDELEKDVEQIKNLIKNRLSSLSSDKVNSDDSNDYE